MLPDVVEASQRLAFMMAEPRQMEDTPEPRYNPTADNLKTMANRLRTLLTASGDSDQLWLPPFKGQKGVYSMSMQASTRWCFLPELLDPTLPTPVAALFLPLINPRKINLRRSVEYYANKLQDLNAQRLIDPEYSNVALNISEQIRRGAQYIRIARYKS